MQEYCWVRSQWRWEAKYQSVVTRLDTMLILISNSRCVLDELIITRFWYKRLYVLKVSTLFTYSSKMTSHRLRLSRSLRNQVTYHSCVHLPVFYDISRLVCLLCPGDMAIYDGTSSEVQIVYCSRNVHKRLASEQRLWYVTFFT